MELSPLPHHFKEDNNTTLLRLEMKKPTDNKLVEEFLQYDETIRGLSMRTVEVYRGDLYEFFQYYKRCQKNESDDKIDISIKDITLDDLRNVTETSVHGYLSYTIKELNNGDSTRRRKISTIKCFYSYVVNKRKLITVNPVAEIEMPKMAKREASYLELDESIDLLKGIKGRHHIRDKAIITIFLNCGLRLSELTGIKIRDIKGDHLRIIGKGDKERAIFLNEACLSVVQAYQAVRQSDSPYLFISGQNKPISNRAVQNLVKKHLSGANLDTGKISTHKLRHTSATLMFKYGNVDVRTLQQILGHSTVATTELYTHVDDDLMRKAVSDHPLSNVENTA